MYALCVIFHLAYTSATDLRWRIRSPSFHDAPDLFHAVFPFQRP